MRPTGGLHLGHLVGALENWAAMQDEYETYYCIVDWHALTTDYADTSKIKEYTLELAVDWLCAGLDPDRSALFIQSHVPEHAELHVLLSMVVPLPWLERVPTYKEQMEQIADKDLHNYGFLGYPVLQTADILMYKGGSRPGGGRSASARRVDPGNSPPLQQLLWTGLPGATNQVDSDSEASGNRWTEDVEELQEHDQPVGRRADDSGKLRTMMTDPARKRRTDPGNPIFVRSSISTGFFRMIRREPGRPRVAGLPASVASIARSAGRSFGDAHETVPRKTQGARVEFR